MGTALRWLAGLAGLAGLIRLLSGRRRPAPGQIGTDPPAIDPANELRRKLAEARGQPQASEPEHAQEPAAGDAERALGERRGDVHARAREAIDAMRGHE